MQQRLTDIVAPYFRDTPAAELPQAVLVALRTELFTTAPNGLLAAVKQGLRALGWTESSERSMSVWTMDETNSNRSLFRDSCGRRQRRRWYGCCFRSLGIRE